MVIQASQFEGHVRNARTWPSISKQSAKIRWSKRSPKLECRGTTELDIGSEDWDLDEGREDPRAVAANIARLNIGLVAAKVAVSPPSLIFSVWDWKVLCICP